MSVTQTNRLICQKSVRWHAHFLLSFSTIWLNSCFPLTGLQGVSGKAGVNYCWFRCWSEEEERTCCALLQCVHLGCSWPLEVLEMVLKTCAYSACFGEIALEPSLLDTFAHTLGFCPKYFTSLVFLFVCLIDFKFLFIIHVAHLLWVLFKCMPIIGVSVLGIFFNIFFMLLIEKYTAK